MSHFSRRTIVGLNVLRATRMFEAAAATTINAKTKRQDLMKNVLQQLLLLLVVATKLFHSQVIQRLNNTSNGNNASLRERDIFIRFELSLGGPGIEERLKNGLTSTLHYVIAHYVQSICPKTGDGKFGGCFDY